MPIGLAPFTIRYHVHNKNQVEAAYKRLKDLGFNGLENGIGRQHGLNAQEDNAMAAKNSQQVITIWGDSATPDETMATASAYNTKVICVNTLSGDMMLTPDGFKAYAENLNNMAKPFAANGFKLSYHNHAQELRNFSALNGKTGFEILIEETNPESVCFCLDTFWISAAGGDPAYWIKKLKGRAWMIHFKDYAIDDRSPDTGIGSIPFRFAEVGQGNVNWHAVMEACREIGIEWYCIEQDFTRGDAFDSLKISIDFIRNVLNVK